MDRSKVNWRSSGDTRGEWGPLRPDRAKAKQSDMPRRFVLDSNSLDSLVATAGQYEQLRAAIDDGRIELLVTHVTIDEVAAVPDLEKRRRLLLFYFDLCNLVATGAFVLDYSRLNFARLADDADAFEEFRKGNLKHTNDALIVTTAIAESAAVLTNDARMAKRATSKGVTTTSTDELLGTLN